METLFKFISSFSFLYSNILLSQGGEGVLSVLFVFLVWRFRAPWNGREAAAVFGGLKLQSL